jgi:hypothetical protein
VVVWFCCFCLVLWCHIRNASRLLSLSAAIQTTTNFLNRNATKKRLPTTTSAMATEAPPKKKESWPNSESKALLRSGILSGLITPTMLPKQVYNMNPEVHKAWKYTNWCANLRSLQKAVGRDRGRMLDDVKSFAKDLAIVRQAQLSNPPKKPWHLSDACRLLKDDVSEGRDKTVKPMELYYSRPEYHEHFSLEVFRKHIYQERDSRPKRAFRFEKKKKRWNYPELHQDHPRMRNGSNVIAEVE